MFLGSVGKLKEVHGTVFSGSVGKLRKYKALYFQGLWEE